MIKSIAWASFFELLKLLTRIASVVILARYIPPIEYGVFTGLLIIISFSTVFTDASFGALLINKKNTSPNFISSIASLSLFTSLLIYLVLIVNSTGIGIMIGMPRVSEVIPLLSMVFLFRSIALPGSTKLQRDQNFYKYSKIEFLSYAVSVFFIGIPMAFYGYDLYALCTMHFVGELLRTILFMVESNRNVFIIKVSLLKEIKEDLQYVLKLCMSAFINRAALQVDRFMIAKFWGAEQLGFYSRMYYLSSQPANIFGNSVSKVFFADFSKYKNDIEYLKKNIINSISLIFIFFYPITLYLSMIDVQLIRLILGDTWVEAANVFGILLLTIPFKLSQKVSAQILKSQRSMNSLIFIQISYLLVATILIYFVIGSDLESVTYAVLFGYMYISIVMFLYASVTLGFTIRDYLTVIFKILFIITLCNVLKMYFIYLDNSVYQNLFYLLTLTYILLMPMLYKSARTKEVFSNFYDKFFKQ